MNRAGKETLQNDFQFTTWLILNHVEGISDDESVLQLPFEANCLNWIMGHIISRRNSVLEALGKQPIWDADVLGLYKTGSMPVRDGANARPLSMLTADLQKSQELIDTALDIASDADLDKVVENDRGVKTAAEHLQGFHWHETYHLGQLDLLRAYIISKRNRDTRQD